MWNQLQNPTDESSAETNVQVHAAYIYAYPMNKYVVDGKICIKGRLLLEYKRN